VVDRGRNDEDVSPYTSDELQAAWTALGRITDLGGDVGIARLESFEEGLDEEERTTLFPYEPRHLLLRRELDEIFDTTPDLAGADVDISRFIRVASRLLAPANA
jgi:CRISPR-associated endonuclease/helicase Cas3